MAETNGFSKLAGKAGSLMALVGVLFFMLGIFGMPRTLLLAGLALIGLSLVAYLVEELGQRRAA